MRWNSQIDQIVNSATYVSIVMGGAVNNYTCVKREIFRHVQA